MIPATRWRRAAAAIVIVADVVVLGVVATLLAPLIPFVAVGLIGATAWGVWRPGGWGAFALVLWQALGVAVAGRSPTTTLEWALASVAAIAVCATHLALSLLAAWPVRAALPTATAWRWARQAAFLAWAAIAAAALGASAAATPTALGPWLVAAALALVAGVTAHLRLAGRNR